MSPAFAFTLRRAGCGLTRRIGAALLAAVVSGAGVAAQQRTPPPPLAPRAGVTPGLETRLTLEELVELVLKQNPGIQAARIDRESAALGLQAARGLFDPQITADSSYEQRVTPVSSTLAGAPDGRLEDKTLLFAPTIAGLMPWGGGTYTSTFSSSRAVSDNAFVPLRPQYPTYLSITFTQPLMRNRGIDQGRRQLQVAQVNQALTDAQFRQQVTDIVTAATLAYWDLSFAIENLDVQQDGLTEAREQVAANRRMADAGLLSRMDVIEAEAQVAIFEGNAAVAQTILTRTENALKALMLPDRASPLWSHAVTPVTPPSAQPVTMSVDQAVRLALANRPERTALDRSADINAIDTQFHRGQAQAQVDLIGGYTMQGLAGQPVALPGIDPSTIPDFLIGGYGTSLGLMFERDFPVAHIGLRLTLPIWNRTAEANVALSLAAGRRLALQKAQLEQSIESDVRNALQTLRSAEAQLAAAVAGRDAAAQQYDSEERRLASGLSTVYLLFQRHSALVSARGRENQARTELSKATMEFERVTGTTLERHGISIP